MQFVKVSVQKAACFFSAAWSHRLHVKGMALFYDDTLTVLPFNFHVILFFVFRPTAAQCLETCFNSECSTVRG